MTLNKIGLELPQVLQRSWEGKLKAVKQSDAQLEASIRTLDPPERDGVRNYVRAITNVLGDEEGAASGSKRDQEEKEEMMGYWTISLRTPSERGMRAGLIRIMPSYTKLRKVAFVREHGSFEYKPRSDISKVWIHLAMYSCVARCGRCENDEGKTASS